MRRWGPAVGLVLVFGASHALAADPPASVLGCTESVPQGMQKPIVKDSFPDKGMSGYAPTLVIEVEHGKGESVLPRGLELQANSDSARMLKLAGFVLPDQDGGGAARLTPLPDDPRKPDRRTTRLELPLLALPPDPGRHVLVVPPLPVAVSRASGEIDTVCTREHKITVDDPIASTNDPEPKPNPPPRKQREEWTALKQGLIYTAIGVVAGALIAYLVYRFLKRPRPAPPPPPPRPPWEVALEKLDEVRHAGLLETERYSEYFDRVNDAVRQYLGARFGFDGLECTSDEIMLAMERAPHFGLSLPEIRLFLQECDLVKFANVTPSVDECRRALDHGERIVRMTMPREVEARA